MEYFTTSLKKVIFPTAQVPLTVNTLRLFVLQTQTHNSLIIRNIFQSCYWPSQITAIDVESYSQEVNSNIFKSLNIGKRLAKKQLGLPGAKPLPNTSDPLLPYVFVVDEAFGLIKHLFIALCLMTTSRSSKKVFNYRLT